jgi:hypothetical protein
MPRKPDAGRIRCKDCAHFAEQHRAAGLCRLADTAVLPVWVDPVSKIANLVDATDSCDFGQPKPELEYVL